MTKNKYLLYYVKKGVKMDKKFYLMKDNAKLLGVASGLAYYLNLKTWIVRVLFVVLAFCSLGLTVLAYLLVGMFAPKNIADPLDYKQVCE